MLTVFLIAVVKYLTRSNSGMEEMVLSCRSRDYSPSMEATRREERKLAGQCACSQKAERSVVFSSYSLYTQSGLPA